MTGMTGVPVLYDWYDWSASVEVTDVTGVSVLYDWYDWSASVV